MFTYSHANTPLGQSERPYYLSYFINTHIHLIYNHIHLICTLYTSIFILDTPNIIHAIAIYTLYTPIFTFYTTHRHLKCTLRTTHIRPIYTSWRAYTLKIHLKYTHIIYTHIQLTYRRRKLIYSHIQLIYTLYAPIYTLYAPNIHPCTPHIHLIFTDIYLVDTSYTTNIHLIYTHIHLKYIHVHHIHLIYTHIHLISSHHNTGYIQPYTLYILSCPCVIVAIFASNRSRYIPFLKRSV